MKSLLGPLFLPTVDVRAPAPPGRLCGGGVPEIKSASLCGSTGPLFNRGRVSQGEGQGPLEEAGSQSLSPASSALLTVSGPVPAGCLRVFNAPSQACVSNTLQAGSETRRTGSPPPRTGIALLFLVFTATFIA